MCGQGPRPRDTVWTGTKGYQINVNACMGMQRGMEGGEGEGRVERERGGWRGRGEGGEGEGRVESERGGWRGRGEAGEGEREGMVEREDGVQIREKTCFHSNMRSQ